MRFDYVTDSHFSELKALEIFREKLGAVNDVDPYLGKYFSTMWVKKNVLKQTDKEVEDMQVEMETDAEAEQERNDDMPDQMGDEQGQPDNGFPEAPPEQV